MNRPPSADADRAAVDVTQLLNAGDPVAWQRIHPAVDGELRRIARARLAGRRDSVRVTELVHEVYARLLRRPHRGHWRDRRHFYSTIAKSMRDLLVDRARRRGRQKRGGGCARVTLHTDVVAAAATTPIDAAELVALDAALGELERRHPDHHEVVMLRYFAELPIDDVADALAISPSTVDRRWRFARAWLERAMDGGER